MFFLGFFAAVNLLFGCCCSLDRSTRSSNIKLPNIMLEIICCIITPILRHGQLVSKDKKREQNSFIFENFYFQLKLRWLFVAVRTSLFLFTLSSRMRPSHEILYEKMALIVKIPEKNPRFKLNIKIRNPVLSAMIDQCEGDETGGFDLLLVSWPYALTIIIHSCPSFAPAGWEAVRVHLFKVAINLLIWTKPLFCVCTSCIMEFRNVHR